MRCATRTKCAGVVPADIAMLRRAVGERSSSFHVTSFINSHLNWKSCTFEMIMNDLCEASLGSIRVPRFVQRASGVGW